jgi:hypothetical protein
MSIFHSLGTKNQTQNILFKNSKKSNSLHSNYNIIRLSQCSLYDDAPKFNYAL